MHSRKSIILRVISLLSFRRDLDEDLTEKVQQGNGLLSEYLVKKLANRELLLKEYYVRGSTLKENLTRYPAQSTQKIIMQIFHTMKYIGKYLIRKESSI